jgi:RNA polymerase sigma factor (sigma-70 family)
MVKSAGDRGKAGLRTSLTEETIRSRIPVPAYLQSILAQPGSKWTLADVERVSEWIEDKNTQAFQAMRGLVQKQLRLTPKEMETEKEVEADSVLGDKLKDALDQEATDWLGDFLRKQFWEVVRTFRPAESASFLIHLCAHLENSFEIDLPAEVSPILSKGKSTRIIEDIEFAVKLIAESWWDRLLRVARAYLGYYATPQDAEDACQEYFKAGAIAAVRNFDAARGRFWPYLRFCFVRFCWKQGTKITRIHQKEKPIPTAVVSDEEKIEIELPDPNAIQPGKRLELEEWLQILQNCLRKLKPKYRAVVDCYLNEMSIKEIAEALNLSEADVKTTMHRARHDLRQMPEYGELRIGVH